MPGSEFEAVDVSAELRALNSTFATVAIAPDGIVLRANNRFLRLFESEPSEIVGRPYATLVGRDDASGDEQARLWEALRQGKGRTQDHRRVRKDGTELRFVAHYAPLADALGNVTEIVAIVETSTEHGEQERRLIEQRGQIEALGRSHGVILFALDGTILDANDRFLATMDYARGDIVGRNHRVLVDPLQRDGADEAAFWARLTQGEHQAGEYKRVGRGGREIWLWINYDPILDPDDRPCSVVAHATDITQEKLRQAEHEWQVAAMHKSNCVIAFDMHGTVLDANDQFLDAVGYRIDEIQGRSHRMFVDPSYAHGAEYAAFWRALGQGQHQAGQFKRIAKGGREIWLQATYNPIFDMSGRPFKIVKYATDITQEKLRQADHEGQIAAIHKAQCVISFALDGTIVDANDNFLDAMGYRLADIRGRHHRMFVEPPEAEGAAYAAFWSQLAHGRHQAGEYKRIGRDGREIWLGATYNPILDMNGRPFKIVKYAIDITQEKLRQADYEGQIAAIRKSQGVITLAMDGTILDANESFLSTLGYRLEEIRGRHHRMLVEPDHAASSEYARFWETLSSGTFVSGMHKRLGKNGRQLWLQASYNPILDLNGRPSKVIKFATDVTSNVALAEAFDDAKRQAQHDASTALPNRVRLASFMAGILGRPGARMVVLYLDLDRFKPINDTFGHHVGDRVLGEVADRLRRCLGHDQIVARVGGDEFVIAAPDLPNEAIEPFCQRLIAAATLPIRHDIDELKIGLSIGIAVSPTDGTTPDELLRNADAALYRSKQSGRGTFSFYATEMNNRIVANRVLMDDMRRGIAAGEFFLEYQPRIDTRARSVRSVEALLRWAHPERGRINPADFIPLAERSGLIVPLGAWVLRTACRAAASWPGIGVSVNVSPIQFRDGNLVSVVADALAAAGLDASRLEIEITEGVLMEDAERARAALEGLKALGVRLAMDDFGTGYSSLSYLRSFPFDVIKIDRRFVADIENRDSGRAIVQAILGLGKALGLTVTAEGVETTGQLAILTLDQCPEVQGYLLARPMEASKVTELMTDEGFFGHFVASGQGGNLKRPSPAPPDILMSSCALA